MALTDKEKTFKRDIGQKAQVQRQEFTGEAVSKANRMLNELGNVLNPVDETLNHVGSAAVHIYQSPVLEQIFFVTQTHGMQRVEEVTASAAFDDLRTALMKTYKRKPGRKRSGF